MTTKKPKQQPEAEPLQPGAAAAYLAATISASAAAQQAGSEDEPAEKLVIRCPVPLLRACEKLATQAGRSRNYMAVQLMLAGLDGVLAALPEDQRDLVLLAALTEDE